MRRLLALAPLALLFLAAGPACADDAKALQGDWGLASLVVAGEKADAKKIAGWKLTVAGDRMTTREGVEILDESKFKLVPTAKPKAIDLAFTAGPDRGKSVRGVYKLEGAVLTVCVAEPGAERPKDFTARPKSGRMLFVFRRAK
jgi:uncharacterized protein (TIGR03067 family)